MKPDTKTPMTYPPVRKSVIVAASPERAFRRFTAEMASWWPLGSHSVGGDEAETVIFEERVGGRIIERLRGGRESVWGTVTAWEPPRRVAFTWHPEMDPVTAMDIEVRFTAASEGTRVDLEHKGFERLGKLARRAHRGYPIGWTYVLGLYAGSRSPAVLLIGALGRVILAVRRLFAGRKSVAGSTAAGQP